MTTQLLFEKGMRMFKSLALIPGVLAFSAGASAAQPSSSNMRYFVQDATGSVDAAQPGQATEAAGTGVIGDVKTEPTTEAPEEASAEEAGEPSPASEEYEEEGEEDPFSSDAIRAKRTQAVELFVDYSTFVTDQEDFSPLAYGLKGYLFHDRDLKYGVSVAVENFQLNDDESDVIVTAPAGDRIRQRNIDIEGTAVRFGVHAQYFVENSMNAQISLFGASGKTEKDGGIEAQYYGRTGMTLALGNQWSWEDFTLSWNWLSLTYNFSAKVGGMNLLKEYPSNRSGGMVLLSGLGFGAEW